MTRVLKIAEALAWVLVALCGWACWIEARPTPLYLALVASYFCVWRVVALGMVRPGK